MTKELELFNLEHEAMKRKVIKVDTNTPPEPVFSEEQWGKHQSFMDAIAENLFEDTDKLIFADWLDDQGMGKYAQLVRFAIEEKVWPWSWLENEGEGDGVWGQKYCWWNRPSGKLYSVNHTIDTKQSDPSDISGVYLFLKAGNEFYSERRGYDSLYLALWDYRQARDRQSIEAMGIRVND